MSEEEKIIKFQKPPHPPEVIPDKPIIIEIIAHYPFEHNENMGTFHAYWANFEWDGRVVGADLRGCLYHFKNAKCLHTRLPQKPGINEETKKRTNYPTFSLTNNDLEYHLQQEIYRRFKQYAKDKFMCWRKPPPKVIEEVEKEPKPPENRKDIKLTGTFINFSEYKKKIT